MNKTDEQRKKEAYHLEQAQSRLHNCYRTNEQTTIPKPKFDAVFSFVCGSNDQGVIDDTIKYD